MRWLAAAATAWLFLDAAFAVPAHAGASAFGDPPEQAILWAVAGLVWAVILIRAPSRAARLRSLTLALLATVLLGSSGVPADPGLVVVLLGLTLLDARTLLQAGPAALVTGAALLLALPGLLGTVYPHGALLWLLFTLPVASLTWLLPSGFAGPRAATACLALVVATAAFAALSLASYPALAAGLDLPLAALTGTRLRLMGLHPNLGVPLLVAASIVAAAVAWQRPGRTRKVALAGLVLLLAALLCVRSRTGGLALLFGGALLASARLRPRWSEWAARLAAAAVVLLLLVPLAGLGETRITERTGSMVSKAASFRAGMWELGRTTFLAAPWHGFGPGTFLVQGAHALPGPLDGHAKDDHPHSVVLAVGESFGWPGLLGLALLLLLALRRPRDGDRLGAGLRAALLAVFAANAIDLGGAQNTLYPGLIFVLLGLADAARREAPVGAEATGQPEAAGPARRLVCAGALLLVGFGLVSWAGAASKREPTPTSLARAERLLPLDPEVPVLQAQLAAQAHDRAARIERLERARALLPDSAGLAQSLAQAIADVDPGDPRVEALLDEALRRDPLGLQAWALHRDRAVVHALRDEPEAARDALLAAVLLNPDAASAFTRTGEGDAIEIFPGGLEHGGVHLADLRAELARRREAAAAAADPGELLRLSLREVELLAGLQAWEPALAATETLLGAEHDYGKLRLASIEVARGNPQAAVAPLRALEAWGQYWCAVDLVDALSRAPDTTAAEFEAARDAALQLMRAGGADLRFDREAVIELLEARQRWAERQGDALTAVRCADALEFARR